MKELERILQLWTQIQEKGEAAVLATVVKTQGSSYRSAGARLLLTQDGRRVGSVSGGCLEEDLVKKAWWLTENGPVIRRYDTTPDGEISTSGYGLGCNGIIHVLLERVGPGRTEVLDLIGEVRRRRRPALLAHMLEPHPAAARRLRIDTNGEASQGFHHDELAEAREALAAGSNRLVRLSDARELFLETLTPAIRLLVFGAGDDAVPVTELARYLGWHVTVYDGRSHYARREKFPLANEVVVRSGGTLEIDPWTVAVIMTHSYSQDLEALGALSLRPPRYVGVLGPSKRTAQLMADSGLDASQLAPGIHSPMGLDIGAEGPEQVALAVIAEIQGVLNGRQGGPLHQREGAIHSRAEEVPWVRSIVCA